MQVRTPSTGEVQEVPTQHELLRQWTKASDRQFAVFQLMQASEQGSEEWGVFAAAFDIALRRQQLAQERFEQAARADNHTKFEALLADAMDRGEREAFDEHYE